MWTVGDSKATGFQMGYIAVTVKEVEDMASSWVMGKTGFCGTRLLW